MFNLASEWNLDKEAYPFESSLIAKIEYYLTSPNTEGVVKLGQKTVLKDGSSYGKIIPIPYLELLKQLEKIQSSTSYYYLR